MFLVISTLVSWQSDPSPLSVKPSLVSALAEELPGNNEGQKPNGMETIPGRLRSEILDLITTAPL